MCRLVEGSFIRIYGNSCCVGGLAKSRSDISPRQPRERDISQPSSHMKKQCSSTSEVMGNNVRISHTLEANVPSGPGVANEETEILEATSSDHPFVNRATIAWDELRKEWVGDQSKNSHKVCREPLISWCTSYDELLSSNEPFAQRILLSEMVDFLVDIWHEEGLYD